ncbi:hypothetical protein HMPREF0864_04692 [Enterobacteriaceae bacterium 9_2_54FAA]|jgi:hypothetical protein|nr:hypothetical protein HMPREF0864_04692 [Enterobacteriaceae bacterium 9_2_54FAA]
MIYLWVKIIHLYKENYQWTLSIWDLDRRAVVNY